MVIEKLYNLSSNRRTVTTDRITFSANTVDNNICRPMCIVSGNVVFVVYNGSKLRSV